MIAPVMASLTALTVAVNALPAQQPDSAPPPPPPAPTTPAAPPAPPAAAPKAETPRPPKSSSRMITLEDIERARPSVATALDVVQLLRPQWLRKRNEVMNLPGVTAGNTGDPEFSVFVNDHEMGGLSYLRSLPIDQVDSLRFMTMSEVGARYGPTNGPGIVVIMKQR